MSDVKGSTGLTSGINKLIDVTASGVGAVAGPMLAPWKARKESKARVLAANADAQILMIRAEAHAKARKLLLEDDSVVGGEIELADRVNERISYQEQKRLTNISRVVGKAAIELEHKEVPPTEPDHDFAARFFNEVQDISSEDMQILWAKVLAGEVERPGSTSIRTLGVLRDLDQTVAGLFTQLCSICIFVFPEAGRHMMDARVPSLEGNAGNNSLADFGLAFPALNSLNEHGLIISDYNSWRDYRVHIVHQSAKPPLPTMPFHYQGRQWVLLPKSQWPPENTLKIHGVALSLAGQELSMIVERLPVPEYTQRVKDFFRRHTLEMLALDA